MLPVTIENDVLQLEIWPHIGGKVSSIIDKADNFNLLFNYPEELPESSRYDIPFDKSWNAGWDECFPAIARSRYIGHPYDGIAVPDHGELWGIPTTAAIPTQGGITTVWHGLRFGYQLMRKLRLEGPTIVADYVLTNFAPFDFKFVWSMHALMSLESPVELQVGGGSAFRFDHDAQGNDVQRDFTWPNLSERENLAQPHTLPEKQAWKVFAKEPIAGPVVIRYPNRRREVSISYSTAEGPAAYWGIWINTGGKFRHRNFTIEPTTGRYDEIDRCIRDRSAGVAPPGGRREWSVTWKVGGGSAER